MLSLMISTLMVLPSSLVCPFVRPSFRRHEHNGRSAITPEYPGGTYAYYVTLKSDLTTMYPHIIGPTYSGLPLMDNLNQTVMVPSGTVTFVPERSGFLAVRLLPRSHQPRVDRFLQLLPV